MAAGNEAVIHYTICDEAPHLATYSLLPVVRRFTSPYGIQVKRTDISLASRIIAQFPDRLSESQKESDGLSYLGQVALQKEGNIIKLPNISASVPQLVNAIRELQIKGYNLPDYPPEPKNDLEREVKARYAKALGSAVNPVLREGNSDRRVAFPVKKYAQKNRLPIRVRPWSQDIKTHVSSMDHSDFYGSEKSAVFPSEGSVRIELKEESGEVRVLKDNLPLQAGEVIDATVMSQKALREFFEKEFSKAKEENLMVSLHLKATMMKISDPIIFGHAVSVYFKDVFDKYSQVFAEIGVNPNDGVAALLRRVEEQVKDEGLRKEIVSAINETYEKRPGLAMVNSSKGITNLHVPSDVIIDASMPPMIRDGGMMWNRHDALEPTVALIPDRSYSAMYQAMIEDCKKNGQFDHSKMGSVANVGLMAKKAEEYGSHDKTFLIPVNGSVRVVNVHTGDVIFDHSVEKGDIWRMCQTKDAPIRDWVKLAVSRARASGEPAVFWLDPQRQHDSVLMGLAQNYLKEHDTSGLDISFKSPTEAMAFSCERVRAGLNAISVTGNVLRDYLTDLFPILELGTSAKMLSIVPLLAGGGLFETGAGGSAPKHVEQFVQENHLRWDSLGEYLALMVSFEHLAQVFGNEKAKVLCDTLNEAICAVLDNGKSPSRKAKEIDNRGTTFYLALYWAQALAKKDGQFQALADGLSQNEEKIAKELVDCQGTPVDVGGYYRPDDGLAEKAMRPSETLNQLIDGKGKL